MAVLILVTRNHGGVFITMEQLARHLASRGNNVFVLLAPSSNYDFDLMSACTWPDNIQSLVIPPAKSKVLGQFVRFFSLLSIIRRTKATSVNIHYGGPVPNMLFAWAARIAGCRVVGSCHGVKHVKQNWHERLRDFIAFRLHHSLVALHDEMKAIMSGLGAPPDKVEIIPPVVKVMQREHPRGSAKAKYGISPDCIVGGFIGRFDSNKRPEAAIQSFAASMPNSGFFLLAGAGEGESQLLASCAQFLQNRYLFLGQLEDPRPFYEAIDILFILSFHEAMSLTVREAQQYGAIVISTDTASGKTQIENGSTGFLVPVEDPTKCEAIIRALSEDKTKMSLMQNEIEARFSGKGRSESVSRYNTLLRGQ